MSGNGAGNLASSPKSVRRRDQIVARAADLFAGRGYAAVSVQEIADRTGITGGAIYRHFPSKEAVLQAVMFETIEEWVATAAASMEDAEPCDAIRRGVEAAVQLVVDRPGPLATYVRERHRADRATRRALARSEAQLATHWRAVMLERQPRLTRTEIAVRQQAMNGVLGSLASRPEVLSPSRARALVTDGLAAVVEAPPAAPEPEEASEPGPWRPPVSRRAEILTTAMHLFAERGYHGVGLNEVGQAVGIAGASIYEHFATKTEILIDAYDYAGSLVVAGSARALAEAESAADALEGLMTSYVEVCFANTALITVVQHEGASLPSSEQPRLSRRRRDTHETWAQVLRELRPNLSAGDARLLVRTVVPLVLQLARHRRGNRPSVRTTVSMVQAYLTSSDPTPSRQTHRGDNNE